jgi:hypothetical protein
VQCIFLFLDTALVHPLLAGDAPAHCRSPRTERRRDAHRDLRRHPLSDDTQSDSSHRHTSKLIFLQKTVDMLKTIVLLKTSAPTRLRTG